MQRHEDGAERTAWRAENANAGMVYGKTEVVDADGNSRLVDYWREAQYYSLTTKESEAIAAACNALFAMFVEAGDYIIAHNLFEKLGIPAYAVPAIIKSWNEDSPSVYGRFDIRYGNQPDLVAADPSLAVPKLLEFNADTPTSLLETSVIQWNWVINNPGVKHAPGRSPDQWNNVYDALELAFKRNLQLLETKRGRPIKLVHFAYSSEDLSGEDAYNTVVLADAAKAAGYQVKLIFTEQIKRRQRDITPDPFCGKAVQPAVFFDPDTGEDIDVIFKLHPWEKLALDDFGVQVLWNTIQQGPDSELGNYFDSVEGTTWIEPAYKLMWSNKGILPILWEMFKDDPEKSQYLLPAYFADDKPADMTSYAQKPFLSREGANITLVKEGQVIEKLGGVYGEEGFIYQALAELPNFAGVDGPHHPVLGVWMIDGEASGLGIRESDGLITNNVSFFAPHCILDDEIGVSI